MLVLRPVPAGDKASRSFWMLELVRLTGSKYRPAPPRMTVFPSAVAAQANPTAGEKLAF